MSTIFTIISVSPKMGYTWITLPEIISMDNYVAIEEEIGCTIKENTERVVIDLKNLKELYSSGIGLLVRLRKITVDVGGYLALVNVSTKINHLLTSMLLDKVLPFFATDVEFEISRNDIWEKHAPTVASNFVCAHTIESGIVRVAFSGPLTAFQEASLLMRSLSPELGTRFVLDLTGLDIIDSMGGGTLRKALIALQENSCRVSAYGVNEVVQELFFLLSIDKYLMIRDTQIEAVAVVSS